MVILKAVCEFAPTVVVEDHGTKYHVLVDGKIKHVIPYSLIGREAAIGALEDTLDHVIGDLARDYKYEYATCNMCSHIKTCSWYDPKEPFSQNGECIANK